MHIKAALVLSFGFGVFQCTPAPVEQAIYHELDGIYPQLQANHNNILAHDRDSVRQLRIKRSPFNLQRDADHLELSYVNPQKVSLNNNHGYNRPGYNGPGYNRPGYNEPGETVIVNVPNNDGYNNNNGRPDQVIVNMHDNNNPGYGRQYYRRMHQRTSRKITSNA